jgi:phage shock protein A
MTLIQRMARLFKADLHGILDCLEEPEEVVKQTIRDMEEALAQKEQMLTELRTALQRFAAEAAEMARMVQEVAQRIDLCFQAGNEALARNFIRQRLEIEQQARQVARAVEETQSRCASLEHTIAEQREQLAAVVQQLNAFTQARQRQAGVPPAFVPGHGRGVVSDDEVEAAFLEEKRRRTGSAPAGA